MTSAPVILVFDSGLGGLTVYREVAAARPDAQFVYAADDAAFADPTVSFGVCGHEYFTHVWEVGIRKAKEMLFTSDEIKADDALRLGMVNQVVPRAELMDATLAMARKIATKSRFALKLTKLAANGVQDAQGREVALRNAFRTTRRFLMEHYGLGEDEAISLMSLAVDFGITQVADGNWGVHAVIRKDLFV